MGVEMALAKNGVPAFPSSSSSPSSCSMSMSLSPSVVGKANDGTAGSDACAAAENRLDTRLCCFCEDCEDCDDDDDDDGVVMESSAEAFAVVEGVTVAGVATAEEEATVMGDAGDVGDALRLACSSPLASPAPPTSPRKS